MRHQSLAVPVVVPAPGVPRRSVTVYACQGCGARAVGVQRCEDCGSFMTRVGLGGECPACSEPVAVCELLDDALVVSGQPATSPTTRIRPVISPNSKAVFSAFVIGKSCCLLDDPRR